MKTRSYQSIPQQSSSTSKYVSVSDDDKSCDSSSAASCSGLISHKYSHLQLLALTFVFAGVQFVWTIEMGYGTPYLLSFGLSKSVLTLAWLAGPLSGLFMQPLIGIWFGRRRPFIFVGSVAIILSVLLIAHIRSICQVLGWESTTEMDASTVSIVGAVAGFYVLDFSINAVQATSRSLIVDILSTSQQPVGHSYASVMIAIGNVIGYLAGSLDLTRALPFFGHTQMECLSSIAAIVVTICSLLTCLTISETRPSGPIVSQSVNTFADAFKHILHPHLIPPSLLKIFLVQFFAWFAWFPFSFFSTEYIKELWLSENNGTISEAERMGAFSLFIFSLVSITAGITLPMLTGCLKVKLYKAWRISCLFFGVILSLTIFVKSYVEAMVIMALLGVPMAVSLWIPFALTGSYISAEEDARKRNDDWTTNGEVSHAGVLLGLHNSFIVLPQFLSSFACSVLFAWRRDDGMIWIWTMASLSSVIAGLLASRLGRE